MSLKTLKDMPRCDQCIRLSEDKKNITCVDYINLRQEVIKWVKNQRAKGGECPKHAANILMELHNIEESELI